ncbi:MAG: arsenical pump-driving ATPase [Myxococcota bacterium]
MELLDHLTRHVFFTGKGGVGKTSAACATAVALAERGRRVLLVSTDPASNLDDVLGVPLSNDPTAVPGVPGLLALNIDPEEAARAYRARALDPQRDVVPAEEFSRLEERLAGACTTEVAAFDEFASLLTEENAPSALDHVIFDTAPTGHTLRLLELPAAWSGFLETDAAEASCVGPLSALKAQRARYEQSMTALGDPLQTLLVLVARPDRVALLEAARAGRELGEIGMRNQFLLVNAVFRASDSQDALARALEERGQLALRDLPAALQAIPSVEVPLHAFNLVGLDALRAYFSPSKPDPDPRPLERPAIGDLEALIDEIVAAPRGRLVLVMGKGGVGKTTIAASIAVALASRGQETHLTTTDPAAHLGETLEAAVPGLQVSSIDPKLEFQKYREQTLARSRERMAPDQLALLDEELRSPCYEEVAVFLAFAHTVSSARHQFVVVDTAPTGHTLLLLDTAGAYHHEVLRRTRDVLGRVTTPLMRLRDPDYTKIVIVTTPEPTPVLEAKALQEDLRRAGIEPFAWVINASLAAAAPRDPLLVERARAELEPIRQVQTELAQRVAIVPFLAEEPVGAARLAALARSDAGSAGREAHPLLAHPDRGPS